MALIDVGLKPWEFEAMTLAEYTYYAHGVYLRTDIIPQSLRRIWLTLHNANYNDKILSFFELNKQWPLYIDQIGTRPQEEANDKIKMFRELKAIQKAEQDKLQQCSKT